MWSINSTYVKNTTLILSLALIFALSVFSWYTLIWDASTLNFISETIPQWYTGIWGKILFALFGLITLAMSAALLMILVGYEPGANRQIMFRNESGTISVSLKAIEEFIKRKGKLIPGVRDLHVRADAHDGSLFVNTKMSLELQKNIHDFTRAFQERIISDLESTFGLSNVKEVRVAIRKIYPRETPTETLLLGSSPQLLLKEPELADGNGPTRQIIHDLNEGEEAARVSDEKKPEEEIEETK